MALVQNATMAGGTEGHNHLMRTLLELSKSRVHCLKRLKLIVDPTTGAPVEKARLKDFERSLNKWIEPSEIIRHLLTTRRSIHTVADTYARAWGLGSARNILRHLPREIRDMIYSVLVESHHTNLERKEPVRKSNSMVSIYDGGRPTGLIRHLNAEDYPCYFDLAFMGTDFVNELSAAFHREKSFVVQHPAELAGFLKEDRFASGCIPAEHIRSITIDISLRAYNTFLGQFRSWTSPKYRAPLQQHYLASVTDLRSLRLMRKKNGARIVFRVVCDQIEDNYKFAQVLVPWVYELKKAGCIVEVEGSRSKPGVAATIYDYGIPRSDWEKRIQDNSAFKDDDADAATKGFYRKKHA